MATGNELQFRLRRDAPPGLTRMSQATGWVDRQMPAGDEVFLDHVGFFVADLDDAGRRLARLGFQVSAVNVQTNDVNGELRPSGTSNRLARLRRGYLEVLAATHDTPLADQLKAGLARYEGLHLVALSHDDIPAERERLEAAGFAMQPVVHLRRRDLTLAGAPEVVWSVLRPQLGVMPEGRIQYAKSHHPDRVWQADQIVHPNSADALTDLLFCVADRREAAARFARYTNRVVSEANGVSTVTLDRSRLLFAEPATAITPLGAEPPSLPYIAGQALRSTDIATTRRILAANGVTPRYADDHLVLIAPAHALGGWMLFHDPAISHPWTALAATRR